MNLPGSYRNLPKAKIELEKGTLYIEWPLTRTRFDARPKIDNVGHPFKKESRRGKRIKFNKCGHRKNPHAK